MRKRACSVLLAAAMSVSLMACGSSASETAAADAVAWTGTEAEDAGAQEEEAEQETAAAAGDVKVGMVTDTGGVNDGSFNQSAWKGLQRAGEELGIEVNYLVSKTDSDYAPNLETFIDEDYDLIIAVGYMMADALRSAAEANPDTHFAIIDDPTNSDLDNVTCLMFQQAEASYLVGMVAGMMTETGKVGFVIGMTDDAMNQFGYGYCEGVLDSNPDAQILQYNVNSFSDAAGGKSAAASMIAEGADIIFHAAGETGLGVIEGCRESGIWAIGVDSDQSYLAPETILTSAMKRVDNATYEISKACVDGELESGVITYDLKSEGVDIAPTTDNLPDEVLAAVEEVKEKIKSGELTVPGDRESFELAYGDVYTLD